MVGIVDGGRVALSLAWMTDALDGRLARRATSTTRLGQFDMAADTAVGAGIVVGLTGGGYLPLWFGLVTLVVFGGLFLGGNLAAAMLLQLSGFIPLLWILGTERPTAWWLPVATAIFIGVIDWRRLVKVNIPNFIKGITGHFES